MSNSFRDLERPDAAHRKAAVLMAAISALECLDHPNRQDLAQFSQLFMPLYAAASSEVRRTASATLSRLPRVPDDVVEMLINQPITIAAPFIAHYPLLKESALARAVLHNGAPHARAAARRPDLSPQAIATLRRLNDPSVEGLLILRGLIPAPAVAVQSAAAPTTVPDARPLVDAPPLDPSEKLRSELRALVTRSPAAKLHSDEPKLQVQVSRPGHRAPAQPLNRPTSLRKAPAASAAQPARPETKTAPKKELSRAARRRITEVHLAKLARHASSDQASWFATALADAMDSSFALSERIMMDLSGRQLATALIGLGAPSATIKSALESFFPHLAQPSLRHTLATDLIEDLDSESCTARLQAWQRADSYTTGNTNHVPALAEGKPVRQDAFQRAAPERSRQVSPVRKAG
ncbi:hypothetical protein IMCC20628_02540 [Hoeflea sp. IMCC20628]|uniref:hypothetical protein n=1 Tax=Hoeflea sp. IMCC20628 TaxID=1620421 RepID=UPI00063BE23B|nr:hypothetical protein [Hoeflea sp. IMCC20628]AKI01238.1 hypothetical protein IMCC20628_02540 [Hoeflea sp. IMCC20628]